MRDAFGGVLNIILIAVFLLIVEGILGLIVNYNKAFRMKNTVISAIEKYEGHGCFDTTSGETSCRNRIKKDSQKFGYHPTDLHCSSSEGYRVVDNLFCYKRSDSDSGNNYVYTVVTQVDINIPIINKMMGLSFFQIHGDTRVISK